MSEKQVLLNFFPCDISVLPVKIVTVAFINRHRTVMGIRFWDIFRYSRNLPAITQIQKGKQKSQGRAKSRRRSQPPTPGGRENVTQINVCIANKQMHARRVNPFSKYFVKVVLKYLIKHQNDPKTVCNYFSRPSVFVKQTCFYILQTAAIPKVNQSRNDGNIYKSEKVYKRTIWSILNIIL